MVNVKRNPKAVATTNPPLRALGAELKAVRQAKGLSLHNVAKPAKISAAYLQKLEAGTVKSPSPRVLQRLAVVLEISYLALMELAGYLESGSNQTAIKAPPSLVERTLIAEDLTGEERRAVAAFIAYLKAQRKKA